MDKGSSRHPTVLSNGSKKKNNASRFLKCSLCNHLIILSKLKSNGYYLFKPLKLQLKMRKCNIQHSCIPPWKFPRAAETPTQAARLAAMETDSAGNGAVSFK